MPDARRHRGPHPADRDLFGEEFVIPLQQAVHDQSWLLTHGYSRVSALKLVGDRYQLTERQRTAAMRCACSDSSLQARRDRQIQPENVRGANIAVDGFNLLTTIESALANGILIRGRDGCVRDMASMHGTYRRVEETIPALRHVGAWLQEIGVADVTWLLDRPVSNSGRLAGIIRSIAAENHWEWTAQLHDDPDNSLIALKEHVIVSADSYVIENSRTWLDVATPVVADIPQAKVIPLGGTAV